MSNKMGTWNKKTLDDVCTQIYSGGTPKRKEPSFWDGNFPWLASGETKNSYIKSTNETITEEGIKKSSTRLAYKNSIVMASAGQGYTRGQVSYLMIDTYINQSVICLVADNSIIDSKFLFFNLKNRYNELRKVSDDNSIRGSITTKMLKNLEINLPSLSEQKSIANILSSLDEKVENNNAIIANLEKQAQAIFKSWFVDFEPFQDEEFVDSELGRIPRSFIVKTIGDISKITSGKRPKNKNGEFPIIGASKIMGKTDEYMVDYPVLIIGRVGTLGIVQRYNEKIWPSDNTLVFNTKWLEYLYFILKEIDYSSLNRGSTQPLISQGDIKNKLIIFPHDKVLAYYNKAVMPMFKLQESLSNENKKLAEIRDTLLPKLMSGEIDVSAIEEMR